MNIYLIFIPLVFLALLALPFILSKNGIKTKKQAKTRVVCNLLVFALLCVASVGLAIGGFSIEAAAEGESMAAEQDADANTNTSADITGTSAQGMGFIAAALVTGLAALGAGIAVAAGAPAAIGAISENPKSFGKAIIFVVLGEGIAIYGLLISILIINKL